ncbi:hypothetical protein ACLKA7_011908 [Drosophila subpalustris]
MTSRSPSTASSAEQRLSKRPSRDWIRFDSFRLASILQLLGRHFAPLSVAIATPHGQQTPDPIVPIGGWLDSCEGGKGSQPARGEAIHNKWWSRSCATAAPGGMQQRSTRFARPADVAEDTACWL